MFLLRALRLNSRRVGLQFSTVILAAWTCSGSLSAAPPAKLSFEIWHVGEALEQTPITSVLQTLDGYLWVGTYTGLRRFDGVRVTVFGANTEGLQNSRITALFADEQDVLWIGHETGELTCLSNGVFQACNLGTNWPGGPIESIRRDGSGDLWLLNDKSHLLRYRDRTPLDASGGALASRKAWVSAGPDGRLWVTANGQASVLVKEKLIRYDFGGSPPTEFFESVAPARDGGLWVMSNGRIRKWRHDHWEPGLGICPCEQGFVTEVLETRSGVLLAGTVNDGLYLLRPDGETLHLCRTNGLSHDWVRSLCEDNEGNIWVGTGAGLDGLRPRKVEMRSEPDSFQGRAVLSFTVRPNGDAWVGTEGAGLYHLQDDHWTRYAETNGLANLFVWSVLENHRGELLVGTWGGGLMEKNGDRFESTGDLAKIRAAVVCLYEDRQDRIWIGTTFGLYRLEGGTLTCIAGKEQLAFPDVRTITETPNGALWFGMLRGGLGCWRDGQLRQFGKADGLRSEFVLALYPELDGTLWIGTDTGLCRLKAGKFTSIDLGLTENIISQLVEDDAGNLWMGSHEGILRARKADLDRCAEGQIKSVQCLVYGRAEGLASLKCSGGFQPGVYRSTNGQLWFPTAKGLAIIDPVNATTNTVAPPVVIEEFRVGGELVKLPPAPLGDAQPSPVELRIGPGKQRFDLRYTALSFTAPDKVRFRHRLEGLEQHWSEPETDRFVHYSYLPPGTYTFRVNACNNDEIWNDQGASLPFTVLPLFWQTWWFQPAAIFLAAGVIGALVTGITQQRIHRKLDLLERQRAIERERTRIARDIHDDLGASLTRITLLSQSARSDLGADAPAAADVDRIYTTARELTRAMDEVVWAVNPTHDTFDSLVTYLGRFAQHFLSSAGIRCRLDVPLSLPAWTLTAEIRHNVFLAFKEALNNVAKHAHASEVRVSLDLQPHGFVLVIVDNGHGFRLPDGATAPDGARLASGNGLVNMRKRLEEVGGHCEWITALTEGTRVRLSVPVARHQK